MVGGCGGLAPGGSFVTEIDPSEGRSGCRHAARCRPVAGPGGARSGGPGTLRGGEREPDGRDRDHRRSVSAARCGSRIQERDAPADRGGAAGAGPVRVPGRRTWPTSAPRGGSSRAWALESSATEPPCRSMRSRWESRRRSRAGEDHARQRARPRPPGGPLRAGPRLLPGGCAIGARPSTST
jgi:hypothetical protein